MMGSASCWRRLLIKEMKMVELKWVIPESTTTEPKSLVFRFIQPCVDIGGNLCPGDWTEWKLVPTEVVRDTEFEELTR